MACFGRLLCEPLRSSSSSAASSSASGAKTDGSRPVCSDAADALRIGTTDQYTPSTSHIHHGPTPRTMANAGDGAAMPAAMAARHNQPLSPHPLTCAIRHQLICPLRGNGRRNARGDGGPKEKTQEHRRPVAAISWPGNSLKKRRLCLSSRKIRMPRQPRSELVLWKRKHNERTTKG